MTEQMKDVPMTGHLTEATPNIYVKTQTHQHFFRKAVSMTESCRTNVAMYLISFYAVPLSRSDLGASSDNGGILFQTR